MLSVDARGPLVHLGDADRSALPRGVPADAVCHAEGARQLRRDGTQLVGTSEGAVPLIRNTGPGGSGATPPVRSGGRLKSLAPWPAWPLPASSSSRCSQNRYHHPAAGV